MIVGTFKKKEEEIARTVQLPGGLSGFKRAPVQEGGKEGGWANTQDRENSRPLQTCDLGDIWWDKDKTILSGFK